MALAASAAAQVPSPAEFLGYELGARFTPHHRVVAYVRAVGDASPLVTVETYGETPEGRPLLAAVLSRGDAQAVRQSVVAQGVPQKPAVWLSCNAHRNEAMCSRRLLPRFDRPLERLASLRIPDESLTTRLGRL